MSASADPDDRRRHRRRAWVVPGVVYHAGRPTVVELRDVSRAVEPDGGGGGVGFVSPRDFPAGAAVHLKVGVGPHKHPRPATVAYARRRPDGRFWVGCRFEPAPAAEAAA